MRRLVIAALVMAAVGIVAGSATAGTGSGAKSSVVYNSVIPNGPRANLPSVGPEAYAFNEFGNEIGLAGTARTLTSVTVTLSSWACYQGAWYSGDCYTPAGATFAQPITLNIYNPSTDGGATPGSLIASSTQTFNVPYRPSADPRCTAGDAGKWYQASSKTCFNGLANNITFSFSGVILPSKVVYGIVFNTRDFGPSPTGVAGPADSLNIALSTQNDVTAGSDPDGPGTVWQNSPYASEYCDNGAAGTGAFRLDSPTRACWNDGSGTDYVPAVQFKASNGS
jgi:hypothetical protein